MKILTFSEVTVLKNLAQNHGFYLHFHDACGAQSFSLDKPDSPDDEFYSELECVLAEKFSTAPIFSDSDKSIFTLK